MPQITNTIVDAQGSPIPEAKITIVLHGNWWLDGIRESIPSFVWTTYTNELGVWEAILPPQSTYEGSTYYTVREPDSVTHAFTVADTPTTQPLRSRLTTPVPNPSNSPLYLDDLADVTSINPSAGQFLNFNGSDWEPLSVTPGGSDFYIHNQTNAAATWVINHNLNRFPSAVTLLDNTSRVFLTDVIYSSLNVVTVVNSTPTTGTAILA